MGLLLSTIPVDYRRWFDAWQKKPTPPQNVSGIQSRPWNSRFSGIVKFQTIKKPTEIIRFLHAPIINDSVRLGTLR